MSTNKPFLFKTSTRIFIVLFGILIVSTFIPFSAKAITSTIQITSTPFLAFADIPDSFRIKEDALITTVDTPYTSDISAQNLPPEKYITIQDTRGCGGFNVQVQAAAFLPAPTAPNPSLNNDFRIITSVYDNFTGTTENGVKYSGIGTDPYTGTTGITAPLNVSSTDFTDHTIFTSSPFDTGINILETDTPIDLLQGSLAAPLGRDGLIHISTSFYLMIPRFFAPNDYYTTLTYTITDATTGTCT